MIASASFMRSQIVSNISALESWYTDLKITSSVPIHRAPKQITSVDSISWESPTFWLNSCHTCARLGDVSRSRARILGLLTTGRSPAGTEASMARRLARASLIVDLPHPSLRAAARDVRCFTLSRSASEMYLAMSSFRIGEGLFIPPGTSLHHSSQFQKFQQRYGVHLPWNVSALGFPGDVELAQPSAGRHAFQPAQERPAYGHGQQ